MHDLVIRGGTIVDGTNSAPITGDIAVDDGRITEIGSDGVGQGRRELDADGLVVAPGWVDIHTTTTARSPGIPSFHLPAGTA